MMAECPLGHSENLSFEEVAARLAEGDFDCREDGCTKSLSYEVDEVFWERYNGKVSKRPVGRPGGR